MICGVMVSSIRDRVSQLRRARLQVYDEKMYRLGKVPLTMPETKTPENDTELRQRFFDCHLYHRYDRAGLHDWIYELFPRLISA